MIKYAEVKVVEPEGAATRGGVIANVVTQSISRAARCTVPSHGLPRHYVPRRDGGLS